MTPTNRDNNLDKEQKSPDSVTKPTTASDGDDRDADIWLARHEMVEVEFQKWCRDNKVDY